jgi:hypothetical protein
MSYYFPEGSKFYFSSTFGAAKTATAVSNANPAVVTSTAHALVDRLRAQTPDSLQYLITDLFEEITLFDNRVVGEPAVEATDDGRWRVTFQVQTGKLRADSLGAETTIPMDDYVDVAALAEPAKGLERGRVLARERRRLADGTHTIEMTVDEKVMMMQWVWDNWSRVPGKDLSYIKSLAAIFVNYPSTYARKWAATLKK